MVQANEETKEAKVIVPDDKLSLAIGKDGQNARLAARLTNWKIDVKSYSGAKAIGLLDENPLMEEDMYADVRKRRSEEEAEESEE